MSKNDTSKIDIKEKVLIDNYIKLHNIESNLDIILNDVITKRPKNPFTTIANQFIAKEKPEIISVLLSDIVISNGVGIKASITTNLGAFVGFVSKATTNDSISNSVNFKDYNVLNDLLTSKFISLNPNELRNIDEIITQIDKISPQERLALSIAFHKVSSKHKSLQLHEYIADLANTQDQIRLPLPILTVLIRAVNGISKNSTTPAIQTPTNADKKKPVKSNKLNNNITAISDNTIVSQHITIYPTNSNDFNEASNVLLQISRFINNKLESSKLNITTSSCGCSRVFFPSLEEAVKFVSSCINEVNPSIDIKIGINCAGALLSLPSTNNYNYFPNGASDVGKTYQQYIDMILNLWKDYELISIEDLIDPNDIEGANYLKNKLSQTIVELTNQKKSNKYNLSGIGGDCTCNVQLIGNLHLNSIDLLKDYVSCNTIKLSINRFNTISDVINMISHCKSIGLVVVLSYNDIVLTKETNNNITSYVNIETIESFINDLSIGLGIRQYQLGGMQTYEYINKLNHFNDIIQSKSILKNTYQGITFRSIVS